MLYNSFLQLILCFCELFCKLFAIRSLFVCELKLFRVISCDLVLYCAVFCELVLYRIIPCGLALFLRLSCKTQSTLENIR